MCLFLLVLSQAHSVSSNLLVNSTRAMYRAFEQAAGGGAPQPAESRIALDGQAYTWPQYVEFYGVDARRCWDDAYDRDVAAQVFDDSDASQLAVNAHGEPQSAAAIGERAPHEAYAAPPARLPAIDEGIPHEEAIQHQQNDSDASQLAMLALPSVCTFQQMQEMQPVQSMSGKAACLKQRELRQVCLRSKVFEIDVTESWPQWRAVLRALPPNMQQLIIGDGIAQVKFRLLEGVRDPHYAKVQGDSGLRHVFEIIRVDTSAMHLHYHKNTPVFSRRSCTL